MRERMSIVIGSVGLLLAPSLNAGEGRLAQGDPAQVAAGANANAQAKELVPIFDGKTLSGWKADEGWAVKDREIVFDGKIPSIGWSAAWLQLDWNDIGPFQLSYEARGTTKEVGLHLGYEWHYVPTGKKTKWHKFVLDHDGKEGVVTVDGVRGRKAPMRLRTIGLALRGPSKDKDFVEFRNVQMEKRK